MKYEVEMWAETSFWALQAVYAQLQILKTFAKYLLHMSKQ